MKTICTRSILSLIAASLVVFLSLQFLVKQRPYAVVKAHRVYRLSSEETAAYTQEDAEAQVRKLVPFVEKVTGKLFRSIPKVEVVGQSNLSSALERDYLSQLKKIEKTRETSRYDVKRRAKSEAATFLGKYGIQDKVIYLVPGNIHQYVKAGIIQKTTIPSVVEIIISHELTHALQDQVIDIDKKIRSINQLSVMESFNAAIEGHAVHVHESVAKELGIDTSVINSIQKLVSSRIRLDEPMLQIMAEMSAARFEVIYIGGKRFIEYHHKKGGNKRLWQILCMPPNELFKTFNVVTQPQKHYKEIDHSRILLDLEKYFKGHVWKVENFQITKMMLYATYAHIGVDQRNEIISKMDHVQALTLKNQDDRFGNVSIFVLNDKSFGPKIIFTLENMMKDYAEMLNKSPLYKIENLKFEDFAENQYALARKLSFKLNPKHGKVIETGLVRICNEDIIIEITYSNFDLNEQDCIEIAQTVLQRYNHEKTLIEKN